MSNEDKVREAAYFVWLNNGCPEYVEIDCWLEGENQVCQTVEVVNFCSEEGCNDIVTGCSECAGEKPAKKPAAKKATAKKATAAKKTAAPKVKTEKPAAKKATVVKK